MLLHLVRHGQSLWNLERRLQGQTMWVPLTELGRQQAAGAAEQLAQRKITAIWSSDQQRAVETAEVISTRLGIGIQLTPLLREQALGELEGMSYNDLVAEDAPVGVDISEVRWGGGESVADVYRRLQQLAETFVRDFAEPAEVVVVSHGDTLRVLLAVLAARGHREVDWNDSFANGEVRTLSWP